jgi:hypothetical protein
MATMPLITALPTTKGAQAERLVTTALTAKPESIQRLKLSFTCIVLKECFVILIGSALNVNVDVH